MKNIIAVLCLIMLVGCGSQRSYLYHSSGTGYYYYGSRFPYSVRSDIMCEKKLNYCYKQAHNICGGEYNVVSGPNKLGKKSWAMTVECK